MDNQPIMLLTAGGAFDGRYARLWFQRLPACRLAPLCVVGNINRDVKVSGSPMRQDCCEMERHRCRGSSRRSAGAERTVRVRRPPWVRVCDFVGKVGSDPLADQLQAALTRHGVQAHLARDAAIRPARPWHWDSIPAAATSSVASRTTRR